MVVLLLAAANAEDEWGFSDHLAPLTLREGEPVVVPSAGCANCHRQQYDDWLTSRHRSAWSNDVFQTGYLVEQKDFCVYCHAPLIEQTTEVLANRAWYRAQHPKVHAPLPEKLPEVLAAEGVSCAVCLASAGAAKGPLAASRCLQGALVGTPPWPCDPGWSNLKSCCS